MEESKWEHHPASWVLGWDWHAVIFHVNLVNKTCHVSESRIRAWRTDSPFARRTYKATGHRVWKEGRGTKVIDADLSQLSFLYWSSVTALYSRYIHINILLMDILSEIFCFWNKILKPVDPAQFSQCTDGRTGPRDDKERGHGHMSNTPGCSPFPWHSRLPTWWHGRCS